MPKGCACCLKNSAQHESGLETHAGDGQAMTHAARNEIQNVRQTMIPLRMNDPIGPASPGGGDKGGDQDLGIATKTRVRTKKPSLYRVMLLNDDYTPMEFVVFVLERFFNKSREEATRIMLHVHQKGVGLCGVFTYEVAETKVAQVLDMAQRNEHPLQCVMEKDD